MKIKLAILENDLNYLERIKNAFSVKYAEKLEIYSFHDKEIAISVLSQKIIDVFLVSDSFEIDMTEIPSKCGFAYFVDSQDVDNVRGQKAICKFQKAELIYKQILSVYSEVAERTTGLKLGGENAELIIFSSPCGGVGTSSMAAACAVRLAKQNKRVIYLNLEKFGSADVFFEAEGKSDMSDIIYALKSRKANLSMRVESCVKQDTCGVCFLSKTKSAPDMLEMSVDEMVDLVDALKMCGNYDYIIVDKDFSIAAMKLYRQANAWVWVGDGSDISNEKTMRAYQVLSVMEEQGEDAARKRICMVYDKFSNKTGKVIENTDIKNVGGAPRYEHAAEKQVVQQLSELDLFDRII